MTSVEICEKSKDKYIELVKAFQEENTKINLSSFNSYEDIIEKHIMDSLQIFNFSFWNNLYSDKSKSFSIADIGSGSGFPGLALAIALPHLKFTLIDSIGKKCRAIESIKSVLKLENIEVVNKRVEDLNIKFDVSISRAVAEFKKIYPWSQGITSKDGRIYMYKAIKEPIFDFNDKIQYKIKDDERVIYEFINA